MIMTSFFGIKMIRTYQRGLNKILYHIVVGFAWKENELGKYLLVLQSTHTHIHIYIERERERVGVR